MLVAVFAVVLSVVAVRFSLVIVTIRGMSLAPDFEDGDRVLVLRQQLAGNADYDDIVVVWPWKDRAVDAPRDAYFGSRPYIKRVVGLPGDVIVTDISELEVHERDKQRHFYDENGKRSWSIPEGHVFVQGNSLGGNDSRSWGPVNQDAVLGTVVTKLSRATRQ